MSAEEMHRLEQRVTRLEQDSYSQGKILLRIAEDMARSVGVSEEEITRIRRETVLQLFGISSTTSASTGGSDSS